MSETAQRNILAAILIWAIVATGILVFLLRHIEATSALAFASTPPIAIAPTASASVTTTMPSQQMDAPLAPMQLTQEQMRNIGMTTGTAEYRDLSDDLRAASPLLRAYLCESPPALCGDPRFDAALAALAEHWLVEAQLPVPTWVSEPSRTLEEERAVSPYTDVADVPSAFRRHGVLLAASELESV